MKRYLIAAAMLAALPGAGAAQDVLLDATDPAVLAKAIQAAGYKAELAKNDKGEPLIRSAANGDSFTVEFYGCEGQARCDSFQFFTWYKKEPGFTPDMANAWNAKKRFIKAAIDADGDLVLYMDVTGMGKMTQANFADALDWFTVMAGEMQKFVAEHRAKQPKP